MYRRLGLELFVSSMLTMKICTLFIQTSQTRASRRIKQVNLNINISVSNLKFIFLLGVIFAIYLKPAPKQGICLTSSILFVFSVPSIVSSLSFTLSEGLKQDDASSEIEGLSPCYIWRASVLAWKLEREEDKKPQLNVQGSCGYDLSAYYKSCSDVFLESIFACVGGS